MGGDACAARGSWRDRRCVNGKPISFVLLLGHMKYTILAFGAVLACLSAGSAVHAEGLVTARSLIKCSDFSSVYYVADDGKRYAFPNENAYQAWYEDFSEVKTVSCDGLAEFPLGGVVTYQPGVRMLKLQSSPTVYAVTGQGVLQAIPDEDTARMLYGDDWAQYVDDLPDSFWPAYTVGEALDMMEIPDGIRIYVSSTDSYHQFIDGNPVILLPQFPEDHPDLLRHVISKIQSPKLYERSEPAAIDYLGSMDDYRYSLVGLVKQTENSEDFPVVELVD